MARSSSGETTTIQQVECPALESLHRCKPLGHVLQTNGQWCARWRSNQCTVVKGPLCGCWLRPDQRDVSEHAALGGLSAFHLHCRSSVVCPGTASHVPSGRCFRHPHHRSSLRLPLKAQLCCSRLRLASMRHAVVQVMSQAPPQRPQSPPQQPPPPPPQRKAPTAYVPPQMRNGSRRGAPAPPTSAPAAARLLEQSPAYSAPRDGADTARRGAPAQPGPPPQPTPQASQQWTRQQPRSVTQQASVRLEFASQQQQLQRDAASAPSPPPPQPLKLQHGATGHWGEATPPPPTADSSPALGASRASGTATARTPSSPAAPGLRGELASPVAVGVADGPLGAGAGSSSAGSPGDCDAYWSAAEDSPRTVSGLSASALSAASSLATESALAAEAAELAPLKLRRGPSATGSGSFAGLGSFEPAARQQQPPQPQQEPQPKSAGSVAAAAANLHERQLRHQQQAEQQAPAEQPGPPPGVWSTKRPRGTSPLPADGTSPLAAAPTHSPPRVPVSGAAGGALFRQGNPPAAPTRPPQQEAPPQLQQFGQFSPRQLQQVQLLRTQQQLLEQRLRGEARQQRRQGPEERGPLTPVQQRPPSPQQGSPLKPSQLLFLEGWDFSALYRHTDTSARCRVHPSYLLNLHI